MSQDVDNFVKKAKQWKNEIQQLRTVLLSAPLEERLKWGKPCYVYHGANIAIIQPFKSCLGLMFFKGTLLKDPKKLLVDNGPNSQAARRLEFTSEPDITKLDSEIKAYLKEAISIEKAGLKIEFSQTPEPIPEELIFQFKQQPRLKLAFESLTPGRQRAYLLHFSSAKQSATRLSRIEKCIPDILIGKGMNDR